MPPPREMEPHEYGLPARKEVSSEDDHHLLDAAFESIEGVLAYSGHKFMHETDVPCLGLVLFSKRRFKFEDDQCFYPQDGHSQALPIDY